MMGRFIGEGRFIGDMLPLDESTPFRAMCFAREVHRTQVRKYTANPYADHLAEVAGIASAVLTKSPYFGELISIAWLHDCMEDQGVAYECLAREFSPYVADGVQWLSDMETGNRAVRKAASRARLSRAPDVIQTIKVADLISNTASIVKHDPAFAVVYLEEKRLLLDVLTRADPRLVQLARQQVTTPYYTQGF